MLQLFPEYSSSYACAYWIGVSRRCAWGGSRDEDGRFEGEVMIDNSAWSLSEHVNIICRVLFWMGMLH